MFDDTGLGDPLPTKDVNVVEVDKLADIPCEPDDEGAMGMEESDPKPGDSLLAAMAPELDPFVAAPPKSWDDTIAVAAADNAPKLVVPLLVEVTLEVL